MKERQREIKYFRRFDIDITTKEAYKGGMAFNKDNLPETLLTPPISAPSSFVEDTWERNWSLYFIGRHWNGPEKGILTTLARWANDVAPAKKKLSRQRVQAILGSTAWSLRDYSDDELGINLETDVR